MCVCVCVCVEFVMCECVVFECVGVCMCGCFFINIYLHVPLHNNTTCSNIRMIHCLFCLSVIGTNTTCSV